MRKYIICLCCISLFGFVMLWGKIFDTEQAQFARLEKAAERGNREAQIQVGANYSIGLFGAEKDEDKAYQWLSRAVFWHGNDGNERAEFLLNNLLSEWIASTELDDSNAKAKLFKDSFFSPMYFLSKHGSASNQNKLGEMYYFGKGVENDFYEAAQWFRKAAEKEYEHAQYSLGFMYIRGQGVIRDRKKGCEILRASAEKGYKDAINEYNNVCAEKN